YNSSFVVMVCLLSYAVEDGASAPVRTRSSAKPGSSRREPRLRGSGARARRRGSVGEPRVPPRQSWSCQLHFLEREAGAVVRDAEDRCRPADAVAVDVTGTCGVDDRVHDTLGDLVADDEDQIRLRQEPGLEDPPAVLVRDPFLAAVT